MKSKFLLMVFIIGIGIIIFIFVQNLNFPIAYKVCGLGYQNCRVVAKFKDRDDCETTKAYWSWVCDQTDKENFTCKEDRSTISSAYCE